MSSSASLTWLNPTLKRRRFSHLLISFVVSPCTSNNVRPSNIMLTLVLHGDFRESSPESLEFHVKYDTDPNTNLPALRVKYLEFYPLKPIKALLSGNRKVIPVHNARFTDYHNILYYIYTGSLNLRYPAKDVRPNTPLGSQWDNAPSFPRPANPNEIYRLAGIMGLGELQGRSYHYLSYNFYVDNNLVRLFYQYC